MKEVTYEDWQKETTPRMMWVWDDNPDKAIKRKVIYFSRENITYPVIVLTNNDTEVSKYAHCAEIEKQRRMTNRELSRWLREKPTREYKFNHCDDNCIHSYHNYYESNADKEVDESVVIREGDSDWREPLVEVEE